LEPAGSSRPVDPFVSDITIADNTIANAAVTMEDAPSVAVRFRNSANVLQSELKERPKSEPATMPSIASNGT
jgi:hypothetical protein